MSRVYSFGVAQLRFAKIGAVTAADIKTMHEQVDGTETGMKVEKENATFLAKGINGPVFMREGRSKAEISGTYYLDFEIIKELFPENVEETNGSFKVKSAISREIKPIQLDVRPLGETSADNCIYFPTVYPSFKEDFSYDIDKPTQVEITFSVSNDDAGVMYELGKEITVTP